MVLARPSRQSDKMEFRPTSILISTGSIARPRNEARDRKKRVDGVWVPDSTKEDPGSAGRRSLRHDEQEFSRAYSMALSVPRPVMGWADAACAPAAEKVNFADGARSGRCRNACGISHQPALRIIMFHTALTCPVSAFS